MSKALNTFTNYLSCIFKKSDFFRFIVFFGMLFHLTIFSLFSAEQVAVSTEIIDISEFTANYSYEELPPFRIDKITMKKYADEISHTGYHDFFLIDIAPSAEYDKRHLDGAVSIPVSTIQKHAERLLKLQQEKRNANNNLWVRVYSHNSVQEAKEAAKKFVMVGLKEVNYLDFTLDEWHKTGKPVVTRSPYYEKADTGPKLKEPKVSIIPVQKDKLPIINSLEVGPGEIPVLTYIQLGKTQKLSELVNQKITVKNNDNKTHKYNVIIRTPEEVDAVIKSGYESIPDVSWIQPEYTEIEVSGNSSREMELYLKVPDKNKFLNKKYQAVLEVRSQKEKPEDVFILVVQMLITFKTDMYSEDLVLTIVSNENINTGADYSDDLPFLKNLPATFKDMKIEKVGYLSPKGKQIIKDYKISFLPAYIFNPKIEQMSDFGDLLKKKLLLKVKGGNYTYSNWSRPGIFINNPAIPKTLEIFYSLSSPPFGDLFIKEVIAAKRSGKISKDINLIFKIIDPRRDVNVDGSETNQTLDTLQLIQLEEAFRWAYIQKYHKEKFLNYLHFRIDNISSHLWEESARQSGLNIAEIRKAISSNDTKKLAEYDFKKANELQPTTVAPYFLYENKVFLLDPKILNTYADFKNADFKTAKPCCGGTPTMNVDATSEPSQDVLPQTKDLQLKK